MVQASKVLPGKLTRLSGVAEGRLIQSGGPGGRPKFVVNLLQYWFFLGGFLGPLIVLARGSVRLVFNLRLRLWKLSSLTSKSEAL